MKNTLLHVSAEAERGVSVIEPAAFTPGQSVHKPQTRWNRLRLLLGLALALSLGCTWYLFSARSVLISIEPAADYQLSGGLTLKLGQHYLLRPGQFSIHATHKGYYPLEQTFTVGAAEEQRLHFSMQKLPGQLTVTTQPAVAAEVIIDGERRGLTNQPINNVKAGRVEVVIRSERYLPQRHFVEIEGMERAQNLALTLQPAWAEVSIDTRPSGAKILIDGEKVGTTPDTLEIIQGQRRIQLALPGYRQWDEVIELRAGESLKLPPIQLKKVAGLVSIQSSPSGAGVTIDGKFRGNTPLQLALESGQNYQLSLFKDGYLTRSQSLAVTSEQEQQLKLKLNPVLGRIQVQATPSDALLYVDGRLLGRAAQNLQLPARQHQIRIHKDGYTDYISAIIPRPSSAQVIAVQLKTLEQSKWENIPEIITTSAGGKLKLFRPQVRFQVGASRREQGRRANESYRSVELKRAFYLGTHEVTNAEYRAFEQFHSSSHVKGQSLNGERQPVVHISWQQAARYCNWLSEKEKLTQFYLEADGKINAINPQSNGYRLPTEAEWAWAARWQADGTMRKYPWGRTLPPKKNSGNYADRSAAQLLGNIQVSYNDGYPVSAPVGSFSANDKGLFDLGGNVAEWVSDFYGIATGLSLKTQLDPTGPSQGEHHVIRGSSWAHGTVTELRLSFRDYATEGRRDVGFRLARYVE